MASYVRRSKHMWNKKIEQILDEITTSHFCEKYREKVRENLEIGSEHPFKYASEHFSLDLYISEHLPDGTFKLSLLLFMKTMPEAIPEDYEEEDIEFIIDNLEIYIKEEQVVRMEDYGVGLIDIPLIRFGPTLFKQLNYFLDENKAGMIDAWIP